MDMLDKIKESLFQGTEKITDVKDKIVEKGKKVGADSVEATREIFLQISERASDVSALSRLRRKLSSLPMQLEEQTLNLGRLVLTLSRSGEFSPDNETILDQLNKLDELESTYKKIQNDYEQLKKRTSSNHMIEKLSEDLSSANAIIDQVTISDQSNVVNKLLKEILLPKEALVSAVKRDEDVIIPDGNTRLQTGDQVIVIGKKDDVQKVVKRFAAN